MQLLYKSLYCLYACRVLSVTKGTWICWDQKSRTCTVRGKLTHLMTVVGTARNNSPSIAHRVMNGLMMCVSVCCYTKKYLLSLAHSPCNTFCLSYTLLMGVCCEEVSIIVKTVVQIMRSRKCEICL